MGGKGVDSSGSGCCGSWVVGWKQVTGEHEEVEEWRWVYQWAWCSSTLGFELQGTGVRQLEAWRHSRLQAAGDRFRAVRGAAKLAASAGQWHGRRAEEGTATSGRRHSD
ncbi:hypothetical protein ACJRO7_034506 [Eucalyptus globulus]|uniref:Uncharacterized protein n=1 Tax=Eucalyptus globulus TaxID=34317 RepID=A0ABD3J954_EUCGL